MIIVDDRYRVGNDGDNDDCSDDYDDGSDSGYDNTGGVGDDTDDGGSNYN